MSEGWKDGRFGLFRCPVCGDRSYVPVRVQRPGGNWYQTPFFQCVGCTTMFMDPVCFSGRMVRLPGDAECVSTGAYRIRKRDDEPKE